VVINGYFTVELKIQTPTPREKRRITHTAADAE